jgi:NhaA family Na+:H+ antiporter
MIGGLLWVSIYQLGLHPTIAGVILALLVPIYPDKTKSPLHKLEAHLHPWVAYLVMPLFALANAGFSLQGMGMNFLLDSVVLGIMLGLFVGKQIGVFGFTWFFVKLKWMKLPDKVSWPAMYGVSLLCGIGFTMSLFLGTLAFDQEFYLSEVRMGVMLGSILSGLAGAAVLRVALKRDRG